jgi:predicted transcriptional regulator
MRPPSPVFRSSWYHEDMTKEQIDAVLDRVREWPVERQEDAVRMLMEMEQADTDEVELTEEQYARLDQAIAEADRGEFATAEQVQAVFARYRR